MLPPGPLVIVIVPGGADVTKRNTAPPTTRTANRIAAMVMARLTPNISIIIVSRLGLVVGEPPAAVGPFKSVESLSLLIRWQRSLPDPLEQGENPGHVPGKRSSLFSEGGQKGGQESYTWRGHCMELVWNLYGDCMEQHANNTVPPPCPQRAKNQTSSWSLKNLSIASLQIGRAHV